MARFAVIRQVNALDKMVLTSQGWTLYFDVYGRYLSEEEFSPLHRYQLMRPVDVISVLVDGANIEVGLDINDVFTKRDVVSDIVKISNILNNFQPALFSCHREVVVDGNEFVQYIYLYPQGTVRSDIIN